MCVTAVPSLSRNGSTVFAAAARVPAPSSVAPVAHAAGAAAALVSTASLASAVDLAGAVAEGVSPDVLRLALSAASAAVDSGAIGKPSTLTLIDYSRPSVEPRLWVFDLTTGDLLFKELVAHGRNTGDNLAKHFSNAMNSLQSSLGLFVTRDTYVGTNGYSLRLEGLDAGFNDHAMARAIVMHGAPYVDAKLAAVNGRIGRSWGCPALRPAVAHQLIDRIRGGGVVFAYYPDPQWLSGSRFLRGSAAAEAIAATAAPAN